MNACLSFSRLILQSYVSLLQRSVDVHPNASLPRGPKIIAMNHTPGFDALCLPLVLKDTPHFLLQDGLFQIPLIGWLLKGSNQIPVYRGTQRAQEAKERACEILRSGGVIAIFPEGRDVDLGKRIRAKTGAVRMAAETGAPIIPLGLYVPPASLTPVHFRWQGASRCGTWQFSGKSYMRFGEPWFLKAGSNIHAQTEELMDRIYRLVSQAEGESKCASHTLLNPIPQW